MIDFMKDGGPGMILILITGFYLLFREMVAAFRLLIVKDHSKENLRFDSQSVIVGSLFLFILGFSSSVLDFYVVIRAILSGAVGQEVLLLGLKESLGPILLAGTLCALTLSIHFFSRVTLIRWRAPIN